MSDDRIKEARRSLIDGEDGDGEGTSGAEDDGDEAYGGEEKTKLVNLEELQSGGAPEEASDEGGAPRGGRSETPSRSSSDRGDGRRGGRPSREGSNHRGEGRQGGRQSGDDGRRGGSPRQSDHRGGRSGGPSQDRDPHSEGRRQPGRADPSEERSGRSTPETDRNRDRRRDAPEPQGGGRDAPPASSRGDGRSRSETPKSGRHGGRDQQRLDPSEPGGDPRGTPDDATQDVDFSAPGGTREGGAPASGSHHREGTIDGGSNSDRQQMVIPGDSDDGGHDEKTAFVNLDQFADEEPKTFTPDDDEAGFEGSTQFVDINSLMGSEDADTTEPQESDSIRDDAVLSRAYQFEPADIERRGDINLIYAQNSMGTPVLLRQIWSGDGQEVPTEMRERINQLDQLDVPRLLSMNGMLITETGCWVELERPSGTRLSELLEREGPRDSDESRDWLHQIGETIEHIHDADLVYGDLTPSAVWIERDQTDEREDETDIWLEPFDLLSLEDRGDLGPYGPSELKVHPDNRELSPATDVYSLAILSVALLTGTPPSPEKLAELEDDRIQWAIEEATVDSPHERTQTIGEFLEHLGHSGGLDLSNLAEKLDFKVAVGLVMILGFGTIGVLYAMRGGGGGGGSGTSKGGGSPRAAAAGGDSSNKSNKDEGGSTDSKKNGAEAKGGAEESEASPTLAPGPTQDDPRITVHRSFKDRPTKEKRPAQGIDDLEKRLQTLRDKARKKMKEAEGLVEEDQKSLYKDALSAVNRAIELQGGDISTRDQTLLDELYGIEEVSTYYENLIQDIEESLENGAVSNSSLQYQQLSAIAPGARANDFFSTITSAEVQIVQSIEEEDTDDE